MAEIGPMEADHIARALTPIPITEIGTAKWKQQRRSIEQLNVAAHKCASEKRDDFVLRALLAEEKLPVLLHELLSMESWRRRVLPDVVAGVVKSPVGVYMYCYLESILVNLFECIMFHAEAAEGFGDDILELIDYCWRNIAAELLAPGDAIHDIPETDPRKLLELDDTSRFEIDSRNANVSRSLSCISILWFIIDRMASLPLAVKNSILSKNDIVVGMTEVLCAQPWIRRQGAKIQKFVRGQFKDVSREDAMMVCPTEAHAWFCMHFLLCDIGCRREYGYTQHKKDRILRIKRFLNETLVDQIPALVDVQRALEELSFLEPPTGTEEKFRSSLVVEQVPRIRNFLENSVNWRVVKENFITRLTDPVALREDAMQLAEMFDSLAEAADAQQ